MSGLTAFLLLLDAFGKVATLAPVVEGSARLGYPSTVVLIIGVIELVATLAYLVPGSAIVGAILLTGYLGGGVASHLRIEDPLWTHILSPVYIGVLVWVGVLLRDHRLQALIPWRRVAAI